MLTISALVRGWRPDLAPYEDIYKDFHANPELSVAESATAARIKKLLEILSPDFEITPNIGGHGLTALLSSNPAGNKSAPVVLLRADIDALPVRESTGLPYASTAIQIDPEDGVEKPVMHACGHDMHITGLLAAAELLLKARAHWAGTLVLVFQPAEERGVGAQAMVDDGLYSRGIIPVPDVVIGGHVMPMRAGDLGTRRGLVACACDAMEITLHGRQGHSSQPHRTVDPVYLAASTVVRLQGIVSREIDPQKPAVVSVSSIHAGGAHNIIPSTASLKVNIRAFSADTRTKILSSVKRIVAAECAASNAPAPADYNTISTYPLLYNDDTVTAKLEESFAAHFGSVTNASPTATHSAPSSSSTYDPASLPLGGSEDFGILATAVKRPSVFFTYGGIAHEVWDKAVSEGNADEAIPVNHSPFFAPVIRPTLDVAVEAYAVAALTFLRIY